MCVLVCFEGHPASSTIWDYRCFLMHFPCASWQLFTGHICRPISDRCPTGPSSKNGVRQIPNKTMAILVCHHVPHWKESGRIPNIAFYIPNRTYFTSQNIAFYNRRWLSHLRPKRDRFSALTRARGTWSDDRTASLMRMASLRSGEAPNKIDGHIVGISWGCSDV